MSRYFMLLSLMVVLLAGCMVLSRHELYTKNDLIVEPYLEGEWTNPHGDEVIKIVYTGDKKYRVMPAREHAPEEEADLYIVNINGHKFLDIAFFDSEKSSEAKTGSRGKPLLTHLFLRVRQLYPTLQTTSLNESWLTDYLEKNPKSISHAKQNGETLITADTMELQTFITGLEDIKEAWEPLFEQRKKEIPKK